MDCARAADETARAQGRPADAIRITVGLPIFLVLIVGGALMALVGMLLTVAIALAKILIPIAIIYWIVSWLLKSRGDEVKDAPAEPGPAEPTPA